MWAQLITVRIKRGKEAELVHLEQQLQAVEQPGSGLIRSTFMQDQKDPRNAYMLVVFESEDQARAREQDQHRQAGLEEARTLMADIFEGPPTFTDLTVVAEHTG